MRLCQTFKDLKSDPEFKLHMGTMQYLRKKFASVPYQLNKLYNVFLLLIGY